MVAPASKTNNARYGAWKSPITAKFITTSGVRLGGLSLDDKDSLFWLEGRPQEGGRNAVVNFKGMDAVGVSERGAVDVTPKDVNVRTRVHEYGGGAYTQGPGGGIIYSEFQSQRLYWSKTADDTPLCLTPQSDDAPDGRFRFADACILPSGTHLVCVREDHSPTGDAKAADVVNEVVKVALDGSGEMAVLATGKDFYSNPRVSPDGSTLAYVCWDHPAMPWDATELRVCALEAAEAAAATSGHTRVAGEDGDTSVLQPSWHPTSGALYYISDATGFWNLCRAPRMGSSGALGEPSPRCAAPVDFGGSSPGWVFGQQGFVFLPDGRCAAQYSDKDTGRSTLLTFEDSDDDAAAEASTRRYGQADGLPPQFGSLTPASDGKTLYFMGGSASEPGGVYQWAIPPAGTPPAPADASAGPEVAAKMLACSSSQRLPEGYVSVPSLIEFPTTLGTAFAYYYAPTNAEFESADEAAPPLLVKAHGGPTGATSGAFNPAIQFWTSRGFAVLDVDYGGSTGYGREYRRRLCGAWGVVDIDDVCAGAQHLVAQGLADGDRLAIDGGSAGGYTTLGALAFKDVFTAGCSLYGVADLGVLAGDTHKFESRYLDGLVGPYPAMKSVYDERAPINAVDRLSCPILLLQGDEDKIVPPNQAELMHAALLDKGLPCALKMYEGEQHGFRKAENIEDALNSELYFYSRVFGFECAGDDIKPFKIDNLA